MLIKKKFIFLVKNIWIIVSANPKKDPVAFVDITSPGH